MVSRHRGTLETETVWTRKSDICDKIARHYWNISKRKTRTRETQRSTAYSQRVKIVSIDKMLNSNRPSLPSKSHNPVDPLAPLLVNVDKQAGGNHPYAPESAVDIERRSHHHQATIEDEQCAMPITLQFPMERTPENKAEITTKRVPMRINRPNRRPNLKIRILHHLIRTHKNHFGPRISTNPMIAPY